MGLLGRAVAFGQAGLDGLLPVVSVTFDNQCDFEVYLRQDTFSGETFTLRPNTKHEPLQVCGQVCTTACVLKEGRSIVDISDRLVEGNTVAFTRELFERTFVIHNRATFPVSLRYTPIGLDHLGKIQDQPELEPGGKVTVDVLLHVRIKVTAVRHEGNSKEPYMVFPHGSDKRFTLVATMAQVTEAQNTEDLPTLIIPETSGVMFHNWSNRTVLIRCPDPQKRGLPPFLLKGENTWMIQSPPDLDQRYQVLDGKTNLPLFVDGEAFTLPQPQVGEGVDEKAEQLFVIPFNVTTVRPVTIHNRSTYEIHLGYQRWNAVCKDGALKPGSSRTVRVKPGELFRVVAAGPSNSRHKVFLGGGRFILRAVVGQQDSSLVIPKDITKEIQKQIPSNPAIPTYNNETEFTNVYFHNKSHFQLSLEQGDPNSGRQPVILGPLCYTQVPVDLEQPFRFAVAGTEPRQELLWEGKTFTLPAAKHPCVILTIPCDVTTPELKDTQQKPSPSMSKSEVEDDATRRLKAQTGDESKIRRAAGNQTSQAKPKIVSSDKGGEPVKDSTAKTKSAPVDYAATARRRSTVREPVKDSSAYIPDATEVDALSSGHSNDSSSKSASGTANVHHKTGGERRRIVKVVSHPDGRPRKKAPVNTGENGSSSTDRGSRPLFATDIEYLVETQTQGKRNQPSFREEGQSPGLKRVDKRRTPPKLPEVVLGAGKTEHRARRPCMDTILTPVKEDVPPNVVKGRAKQDCEEEEPTSSFGCDGVACKPEPVPGLPHVVTVDSDNEDSGSPTTETSKDAETPLLLLTNGPAAGGSQGGNLLRTDNSMPRNGSTAPSKSDNLLSPASTKPAWVLGKRFDPPVREEGESPDHKRVDNKATPPGKQKLVPVEHPTMSPAPSDALEPTKTGSPKSTFSGNFEGSMEVGYGGGSSKISPATIESKVASSESHVLAKQKASLSSSSLNSSTTALSPKGDKRKRAPCAAPLLGREDEDPVELMDPKKGADRRKVKISFHTNGRARKKVPSNSEENASSSTNSGPSKSRSRSLSLIGPLPRSPDTKDTVETRPQGKWNKPSCPEEGRSPNLKRTDKKLTPSKLLETGLGAGKTDSQTWRPGMHTLSTPMKVSTTSTPADPDTCPKLAASAVAISDSTQLVNPSDGSSDSVGEEEDFGLDMDEYKYVDDEDNNCSTDDTRPVHGEPASRLRRQSIPPPGLLNIENSCHMNSALQFCNGWIGGLCDDVDDATLEAWSNAATDPKERCKSQIANVLVPLLRRMAKGDQVEEEQLKRMRACIFNHPILSTELEEGRIAEQQDATETFLAIENSMEPVLQALKLKKLHLVERFTCCNLECRKPNNVDVGTGSLWLEPGKLASGSHASVQNMIDSLLEKGTEHRSCLYCKQKNTEGQCHIGGDELPETINVFIKRFNAAGEGFKKDTTAIDLRESRNIAIYKHNSDGTVEIEDYFLDQCMAHMGSDMSSGHWVYAKQEYKGPLWYQYSDLAISELGSWAVLEGDIEYKQGIVAMTFRKVEDDGNNTESKPTATTPQESFKGQQDSAPAGPKEFDMGQALSPGETTAPPKASSTAGSTKQTSDGGMDVEFPQTGFMESPSPAKEDPSPLAMDVDSPKDTASGSQVASAKILAMSLPGPAKEIPFSESQHKPSAKLVTSGSHQTGFQMGGTSSEGAKDPSTSEDDVFGTAQEHQATEKAAAATHIPSSTGENQKNPPISAASASINIDSAKPPRMTGASSPPAEQHQQATGLSGTSPPTTKSAPGSGKTFPSTKSASAPMHVSLEGQQHPAPPETKGVDAEKSLPFAEAGTPHKADSKAGRTNEVYDSGVDEMDIASPGFVESPAPADTPPAAMDVETLCKEGGGDVNTNSSDDDAFGRVEDEDDEARLFGENEEPTDTTDSNVGATSSTSIPPADPRRAILDAPSFSEPLWNQGQQNVCRPCASSSDTVKSDNAREEVGHKTMQVKLCVTSGGEEEYTCYGRLCGGKKKKKLSEFAGGQQKKIRAGKARGMKCKECGKLEERTKKTCSQCPEDNPENFSRKQYAKGAQKRKCKECMDRGSNRKNHTKSPGQHKGSAMSDSAVADMPSKHELVSSDHNTDDITDEDDRPPILLPTTAQQSQTTGGTPFDLDNQLGATTDRDVSWKLYQDDWGEESMLDEMADQEYDPEAALKGDKKRAIALSDAQKDLWDNREQMKFAPGLGGFKNKEPEYALLVDGSVCQIEKLTEAGALDSLNFAARWKVKYYTNIKVDGDVVDCKIEQKEVSHNYVVRIFTPETVALMDKCHERMCHEGRTPGERFMNIKYLGCFNEFVDEAIYYAVRPSPQDGMYFVRTEDLDIALVNSLGKDRLNQVFPEGIQSEMDNRRRQRIRDWHRLSGGCKGDKVVLAYDYYHTSLQTACHDDNYSCLKNTVCSTYGLRAEWKPYKKKGKDVPVEDLIRALEPIQQEVSKLPDATFEHKMRRKTESILGLRTHPIIGKKGVFKGKTDLQLEDLACLKDFALVLRLKGLPHYVGLIRDPESRSHAAGPSDDPLSDVMLAEGSESKPLKANKENLQSLCGRVKFDGFAEGFVMWKNDEKEEFNGRIMTSPLVGDA